MHVSGVAESISRTPPVAAMAESRSRSRSAGRGSSTSAPGLRATLVASLPRGSSSERHAAGSVHDDPDMCVSDSTPFCVSEPSASSAAVPSGDLPVVPPYLAHHSIASGTCVPLAASDLDDDDLFDSQGSYLDFLAEEHQAFLEEQMLLELQEAEELWLETLASEQNEDTVSLHVLVPVPTDAHIHIPAPVLDAVPVAPVRHWPGAIAGA